MNRFEKQEHKVQLSKDPMIREACRIVAQRKRDNPKTIADMFLRFNLSSDKWDVLGFMADMEGGEKSSLVACYKMFAEALKDE